jgi:hypothetical protein
MLFDLLLLKSDCRGIANEREIELYTNDFFEIQN